MFLVVSGLSGIFIYCTPFNMALLRMCYVGSLKLLNAISKQKTVTTLRVGYAKKVGEYTFSW